MENGYYFVASLRLDFSRVMAHEEMEEHMKEEVTYTTAEVAVVLGKHKKTLDYWKKEGLLVPVGKLPHWKRQYCLRDAVAAAFAAKLLDSGVQREIVKAVVAIMQRGDPDEMKRAVMYIEIDPETEVPTPSFVLDTADKTQCAVFEKVVREHRFKSGEPALSLQDIYDAQVEGVGTKIRGGLIRKVAEAS